MGQIWIKEFKGGLDTRKLPETSNGAILIKAVDGHISRGGEFEKRAAFVPIYSLPAGQTKGLAAGKNGLYVFGHLDGVSVPTGVTYQQLKHLDEVTALSRVPSYDLHSGKIYAAAQFVDGSTYHFYDGVRVPDWFDGRARATFQVTGGGAIAAVAASGSFEVTGGSVGGGNEITDITIDGVSLISAPVAFVGGNSGTATAVANAINSNVSVPDYTATSDGQTVTITADTAGSAPNGKAIIVTVGGTVTVGNVNNMAGGSDAATSTLADIMVDGVSIMLGPVPFNTSNTVTAEDIADAINSATTSPDYTATVNGDSVTIIADTAGDASNGLAVAFDLQNGFAVSPTSLALADGAETDDTFVPGNFVKTIGSRVQSVSGPIHHGSGIAQPTKWTTDTTGAFFIDMSAQASGAEELTALAEYQNYVAIIAERVILIYFIDSDPTNNRKVQVLKNTGTASPRSVTEFGDNDLFYLDESGIRSLRARDSSNAAATNDIGVPVDTLVTEKLRTMTDDQRLAIFGLIEPQDGRFWLTMGDRIFVFSFFPGSKISAWTMYTPTLRETIDDVSTLTEFEIEEAVVFRRRVYVRSGDTIYAYGGIEDEPEYDETEAEGWLPFLDGGTPSLAKELQGYDVACRGTWQIYVAMNPDEEDANDKISTITESTFLDGRHPASGKATHFGLRFKSKGAGPAKLGSAVIHHDGADDEN